MEEFRAWATLAIALVALIAPFAIWLWRNYYRQGTVDIHETWTIEIGFNSYGPTIGLNGTLQAVNHDLFIRSIDLTVVKLRDRSQYAFEWLVFRPASVTFAAAHPEASIEVPAGFLLTTAQPRRYNITFFDRARQTEMGEHLLNLSAAWQTHLTTNVFSDPQVLQQPNVDWVARIQAEYAGFSQNNPTNLATYTAVDRLFYWDPGDYYLEMRVNTTRPPRAFQRSWTFSLSEAQSASIRQNVYKTLLTTCGQVAGDFNFAYTAYQEA